MNDPFQRAKDIRAGKETLSFDELSGFIEVCPATWLPALLLRIVKQCGSKQVFKDYDSLIRFVEKAVSEKHPELRE